MPDLKEENDLIDHATFDQLLEMDDDEEHEFSKSIVYNYFEQAETTFNDMDQSLEAKDLEALSRLGHFLKGSSAALGLQKVKISCEKLQHYGNKKDETGTQSISETEALEKITPLLVQVKEEYQEAEKYLKNFYEEEEGEEEEESEEEEGEEEEEEEEESEEEEEKEK